MKSGLSDLIMRGVLIQLLAIGLLSSSSSLANEGHLALVGATIIDGTSAAPIENGVLVISDGRVRSIGPASDVSIPDGAQIIEVNGKTVIPGLINAHGHVGNTIGLESGEYNRANLLRQLGLYARYGVTTVFSLGGDAEQGFALRDEQEHADLNRARLFVAGDVITGNSEEQIRQRVNGVADLGADYVKVRVDDNLGRTPKMPRPLFEALVDQAHTRRLPVAVHLFYLEDARHALRAGADLIAHSVRDQPVDQDFISQLREQEVCYIPTLTREVSTFVYEDVPDFFADPFFRKEVGDDIIAQLSEPERMGRMAASSSAQAYKAGLEVAMDNVGILNRAGISVAMGTDTGPPARFQGYFEHMELDLMVQSGMTPLDAIRSATGVAASCMGRSDIGTLEPGNWGDFVVLGANPTVDIANTKTVESVWIAGNRVPQD